LENRLLLAFVLSLAVFVGWGYFLAQVQGPLPVEEPGMIDTPVDAQALPPKSRASGTTSSVLPQTDSPQPVTQVPVPVNPFPGEEVLIQVSTGKAHFVISNRGGVVKQLELPRFKSDSGDIIDLIDNPDHLTPALALQANDPEITAILQNAHYVPSTTSIVLDESLPEGRLTLTLNHSSGLQVTRTYLFRFNDFMVEMGTQISAPSMASRNLQYQVVLGPGMGGKISSQTDYIVFSGATVFANNERIENPPEDIKDTVRFSGDIQWAAFQNKYFGSALIPQDGTKTGLVFKEKDQAFVGLGFESVQSAATAQYLFYAGTKELETLENKGHHLVRMIDYGWFGNKFAFLVKPLLKVLAFFYEHTHNYGWSIIFMTIIIKLLFFPLTHKSFKSMKGMQKVQPYVKIIQERNKDDRQKMNTEMMELYKKHKVNPVGGCLPMLLQIPVFIALYHALFFSIELRGAPFMGWITDLSVADPYYVFPVLMGATMFLQQKLTPSMGDPMQQKIMMFLPIVFTFLFISFPSGLVIYWTVNNILTISQQYYIYHVAKD
jgi:YidC/Oxa1 family membrane protein insertase